MAVWTQLLVPLSVRQVFLKFEQDPSLRAPIAISDGAAGTEAMTLALRTRRKYDRVMVNNPDHLS